MPCFGNGHPRAVMGLTLHFAVFGGQLVLQLSGKIWLGGPRQSVLKIGVSAPGGVKVQPQCLQFVQLDLRTMAFKYK